MKKFLLFTLLFSASVATCFADVDINDQIIREGNNFIQIATPASYKAGRTKYTYTIKNTTYHIYLNDDGRTYILRGSKSGAEQRQYLKEEVSRQICEEMNVEYSYDPANDPELQAPTKATGRPAQVLPAPQPQESANAETPAPEETPEPEPAE